MLKNFFVSTPSAVDPQFIIHRDSAGCKNCKNPNYFYTFFNYRRSNKRRSNKNSSNYSRQKLQKIGERIFLFLCLIIRGVKSTNTIIKVAKIPRIFFFPFQEREKKRERERKKVLEFIRSLRGSSLSSLESRESFAELRYRSFRPFLSSSAVTPPLISIRISSLWTFTGGADRRSSRGWRAAAATFNKAIANLVGSIKQEREEKSDPLWNPSLSSYSPPPPPPPVSCLIPPPPPPSFDYTRHICSNSWPNYWLW